MTKPGAAFLDRAGVLSSATLLHFIGEAIPERVIDFVRQHRPIRGDEVVTAAILAPLIERSPSCRVIELVELASSCCVSPADGSDDGHGIAVMTLGVAICLEHGSRGEVCTVETVADDVPHIHHLLLDALLATEHDEQHGLRWRPPSNASDELALPPNAVVERRILEMRGALPSPGDVPRPVGVKLASAAELLAAGSLSSEALARAVLRINNAAFTNHPEQGAWQSGDVDALLAESWFDFQLLVVAESESGETVGFAVMKAIASRPIELYLVAVDAEATTRGNHRGVGRALVLNGFRRAATVQPSNEAMLFVDAANDRAIALYRSLGFAVERTQMVVAIHPPGTPDHPNHFDQLDQPDHRHLSHVRPHGAQHV